MSATPKQGSSDLDFAYEIRTITPADAALLLQKVRNDTTIDERQVATYAEDMRLGAWKLNGEPLILDTHGVLLSGRLRLHASIQAGASFRTLVVKNIDPSYFDSIDALRRRRVSDILSIRKEKDGRALGATLTALWRFANDDFLAPRKRPSSQTLVGILEENPEIRDSVALARDAAPRLPQGLGGALHFMFSRVDSRLADSFFEELATCEGGENSTVAMLARHLDEGLKAGGARNAVQLAGVTIKAWEACRAKRQLALIRFVVGTDRFPQISGLEERLRFDGVKHTPANDQEPGRQDFDESAISVRVEWVTPQRANEFLERNDMNRAIASAVVRNYARDMENGAWALNGQTIKIASSGRLLDGQHRCAAAIRANKPFPAIVVEGLSEAVFDTFDVGKKRSFAAILRHRGEANSAALAATLRQIWMIENRLVGTANVAPTFAELLDAIERHPDSRESVRASNKTRALGPSIIIALYHFFHRADAGKAEEFLERLADGANLGTDSPILKLRNALLEDRANWKRRLPENERAALIIKAWNFHYEGRPIRVLKWQTSGDRVEAFPTIAGVEEMAQ